MNLTQQTEGLKDGVVWNKNSYYHDNYSFFLTIVNCFPNNGNKIKKTIKIVYHVKSKD